MTEAGRPTPDRPPGRGSVLVLVIGLLLEAGGPPAAAAQEPAPLTKAELVRFLSAGVYSSAELAVLVRRNCLSFEATERDRSDLRAVGASTAVLEAVEWCLLPLDVTVEPATLLLPAGRTATVTLRATQDGVPVAGASLTLGDGRGATAGITDSRGVAQVTVSAWGRARSYRLPIRAGGGPGVGGEPALSVRVLPGAARAVTLSRPILLLEPSADTAAIVRANILDGYGNPVPGASVSIEDPRTGARVATARTGAEGDAEIRIEPGAIAESGVLEIRADGRRVGELAVTVRGGETNHSASVHAGRAADPAGATPRFAPEAILGRWYNRDD